MKRFLLFLAAPLLMLSLAACQTPGAGPVVTPNGSQLSNVTIKVQAETQKYCAYLPVAQVVIAIANVQNPNLQTATEIATAICAAVQTASTARGATPVVQGVKVVGVKSGG